MTPSKPGPGIPEPTPGGRDHAAPALEPRSGAAARARIALVHDWLTGMRGGEKVLEAVCELYPHAELFTMVHLAGTVSTTIERLRPTASFVSRLPLVRRHYRSYLPLFPFAVEQFDLDRFDLVISTSHCAVKSVVKTGRARHLCYCHTPMRYVWEQQAEYRFDLGHYWTTHLKTEVGVSTTGAWEDFEQREAPIARSLLPGVSGGLTYVDIRKRLPAVTPSVTWQFRENTFMHPYVSAGMKVGFLQEHRTRPAGTYRINTVDGPISYSVTAVDERETTVLARPFVAGGFKSYFSRRVFLRSELQLAFARDGVSQAAVRAGVGVDF